MLFKRMNVKLFQKKVFGYYGKKRRHLPWRNTTDPYAILISEIMLQQTQVDRVIAFYERWLKKWPTIKKLAKAPRVEVLQAWIGLGYNSRAKNLHETAKIVSEKFDGDVLRAIPRFKELPGIGPYTSAAVRIFSANEDIVTVDTNIRRIFIHEFGLKDSISDKELWTLAEKCLPKGKSREWHNALMDYGATLLTARKTGIKPKTTQSKFDGSDRQVRARVLKVMLADAKKKFTLEELCKSAGAIPKKRLRKIVDGMINGKLVVKSGSSFTLHNGKN